MGLEPFLAETDAPTIRCPWCWHEFSADEAIGELWDFDDLSAPTDCPKCVNSVQCRRVTTHFVRSRSTGAVKQFTWVWERAGVGGEC